MLPTNHAFFIEFGAVEPDRLCPTCSERGLECICGDAEMTEYEYELANGIIAPPDPIEELLNQFEFNNDVRLEVLDRITRRNSEIRNCQLTMLGYKLDSDLAFIGLKADSWAHICEINAARLERKLAR